MKQLQTPAHLPSRKGTDRACPRQTHIQENGLLKDAVAASYFSAECNKGCSASRMRLKQTNNLLEHIISSHETAHQRSSVSEAHLQVHEALPQVGNTVQGNRGSIQEVRQLRAGGPPVGRPHRAPRSGVLERLLMGPGPCCCCCSKC